MSANKLNTNTLQMLLKRASNQLLSMGFMISVMYVAQHI